MNLSDCAFYRTHRRLLPSCQGNATRFNVQPKGLAMSPEDRIKEALALSEGLIKQDDPAIKNWYARLILANLKEYLKHPK